MQTRLIQKKNKFKQMIIDFKYNLNIKILFKFKNEYTR